MTTDFDDYFSRLPAIPEDNRVYAIGDIHGQREMLEGLLAMVKKDLCDRPLREGQKYSLAFLGDYIDRGPDSKGVIDILVSLHQSDEENIFIAGDHDTDFRELIRFTRGDKNMSEDTATHISVGAYNTLVSYGIRLKSILYEAWEVAEIENLWQAVPETHQQFLQNLGHSVRFNNYILIHRPQTVFKEKPDGQEKEGSSIFEYLYPSSYESHPAVQLVRNALQGRIIVHGDVSEFRAISCELTDRHVGINDSSRHYTKAELEFHEISIHCAVLEKDHTPRFLSYAMDVAAKGPSG